LVATTVTPWGKATVVEEVSVPQRQGDRRFVSVMQLLETPAGETLVRFAYTTGGTARRGPVTLRARDLVRLRSGLERTPRLKEALQVLAAQNGTLPFRTRSDQPRARVREPS
jgi:hypothetical protein